MASLVAAMPVISLAGPSDAPPFSTFVERCIVPAADYHHVNQYILRAILRVESGLKPKSVGRNNNGTVDVGIGQMNSMHFKELSVFGIAPGDLLDPCVGTYVAAWHLKKGINKYGNTWFGIASYHSATLYFNRRYQALVKNELVRAHVLADNILPVPPLRPNGAIKVPTNTNNRFLTNRSRSTQAANSVSVVVNE